MDTQQIKELMVQLEESKLKKLVIKKGDFELHLEKESMNVPVRPQRVVQAETESAFQAEEPLRGERGGSQKQELSGTFVTSPMVGTFYAAPAPGRPPFVKVGDSVNEQTVVCVVEAMKVMNEVKAGVRGVIAEVLVDNAQPVEFGTRLLRITAEK